jgi:citrate synthase
MTDPTMSAQEAADALGVSVSTLYAYVSRGLVRSEAEGRSRARRYRREDVDALLTRKEQRKEPEKVAETALNWGAPVLESSLSLIRDGRLYYRGREAVGLARAWTFERLAAFLWTGDSEAAVFETPTPALSPRAGAVLALVADWPLVERFEVMLPVWAAEDWAAFDTRPAAVAQTGARLVAHLATMASGAEAPTGSVAASLAAAWAPDHPKAAAALDAALILAADHELNVSAFTARCVASAGSTPYAVVTAGLAALRGPKHGGHCDRVEALFAEAGSPRMAAATLAGRLRRGEAVPGFGQPLYPQGDPRGAALLAIAAEVAPGSPAVALATALSEAAEALLHERPTIDFGLVALARALGLPPGAPIALFALGRSVGWIAHAIEQYQTDRLIRPRARYVGLPPET